MCVYVEYAAAHCCKGVRVQAGCRIVVRIAEMQLYIVRS